MEKVSLIFLTRPPHVAPFKRGFVGWVRVPFSTRFPAQHTPHFDYPLSPLPFCSFSRPERGFVQLFFLTKIKPTCGEVVRTNEGEPFRFCQTRKPINLKYFIFSVAFFFLTAGEEFLVGRSND